MLEWYTTLLTSSQAAAVYLVSIVAITVGLGIFFAKTEPDDLSGSFGVAFVISLIAYPVIYWALWPVVAFIDLIGWLWAY